MIIQDSRIAFEYHRAYSEEFSVSEQLVVQSATSELTQHNRPASSDETLNTEASDISQRGVALAEEYINHQQTELTASQENTDATLDSSSLSAELSKLVALVESFTGKSMELSIYLQELGSTNAPTNAVSTSPPTQPQMATLIYQYNESYLERESSEFNVSGSISFADGDALNIDLSQYSHRSYFEEKSVTLAVGEVELVDPLVINLDGGTSQLTQRKFAFDLTAQGDDTSIHFTTGQSGFLAIDSNANGYIDDGSELFGALTGNGYQELAEYDEDNNGFIDSADKVFNELLFYQKDEQGQDTLSSLANMGIGALYLGYQSTPLNIKDEHNELQAKVRSGSFFIYNNKTLGTTQQIDLVV